MPLVIKRIRQCLLSLGALVILGAILTLLLFPQTPVLAAASVGDGVLFDTERGYPIEFKHSDECATKENEGKGWKFEEGLGIPNLPGAPDPTEGPTQFIIWLFVFALGAVGALSFLMLVWAGVQYMAAVGNPTAQGAAKERMTSVILGILLLLASYVILYTINPNLVDLKEPTLPKGGEVLIEGGDRNCGDPDDTGEGGLDDPMDFGAFADLEPKAQACLDEFGGFLEDADFRECMCRDTGTFTSNDDDQTATTCAYTCLAEYSRVVRLCEDECTEIWGHIDNNESADDSDLTAACRACLNEPSPGTDPVVKQAIDGPGDSAWDYCTCRNVAGPSECVVCDNEGSCSLPHAP